MIIKNLYFAILLVCFVTSLVVFKFNKGFRVIPWLMGIVVVVEAITFVLSNVLNINPFIVYHFYILIEGIAMGYFFYYSIESEKARKIILVSVGLFVIGSLTLTFFFYRFSDFPGLPVNILGVMEIAMSLYVLLTLEPIYQVPLYKHPLTWICIGVIIFYAGTYFLNGVYNYLVLTGSEWRVLVHSIINNGLNCLLYLCFTLGLICSHRLKKYFVNGDSQQK